MTEHDWQPAEPEGYGWQDRLADDAEAEGIAPGELLARLLSPAPARPAPRKRRPAGNVVLLGKREAARRLGVDRSTTLERLIREGVLAVVPWGEGCKVPVAEVTRLAAEGIPRAARIARPARPPTNRRRTATRKRVRVTPPGPGVAARIRALPYGRRKL